MLFGQAYTTNALQLTNAVAVIANKGVKKPQRIIKTISDAEGHSEEQKPEGEATRVIDEQVASQVMNAMESRPSSRLRPATWVTSLPMAVRARIRREFSVERERFRRPFSSMAFCTYSTTEA